MNVSVNATLSARGKHYEGPGGFSDTAATAQGIKLVIRASIGYPNLSDAMRESLDQIAAKIARIVNGNPAHMDSWHDIAGYATLIEKELTKAAPIRLDLNAAIDAMAELTRK